MINFPTRRGLRPETAASCAAARLADAFDGLPDGVTRWRLAASLRAAEQQLDLSPSMLRLLLHYIDLSYDADWEAGTEPVITRPVIEIAEHLGKSERQVRNLERALAARGLLAWRDSGNHHRHGRRDRATGRLVYAYGPTLAPLGARAPEIIALAATARRDAQEKRRLRMEIGALRRRLKALAATAADMGENDLATTLATADASLPRRNAAGEPVDTLSRREASLRALCESADSALRRSLNAGTGDARPSNLDTETVAKAEIRRQPYSDTERNIGIVAACSHTIENAPNRSQAQRISLRTATMAGRNMLKRYEVRSDDIRTWSDLADIGRLRMIELGVAQEIWAAACANMGRDRASMCAVVIDAGVAGPTPRIRRPQAYLDALTARSAQGSLRIEQSLQAIWRRQAVHEV